jgi:3-oxoacyl-[acyl-carrier protein] reductase
MDLNLEGKRALVTGSTAGIGAEIARVLAAEGASVVIHGRNAERAQKFAAELRKLGGAIAVTLGELTDDGVAERVAQQAESAFGGVDILINNAGSYPITSWWDTPPEVWLETYNADVVAGVRLVKMLVPGMIDRGWGRVIQMASRAATQGTANFFPQYSSAKAAQLRIASSLAVELAGTGVTSNAISPGAVATETFKQLYTEQAKKEGRSTDWDDVARWWIDHFMPGIPLGRMITPREVADLAVFLASPCADAITGSDFIVDGGLGITGFKRQPSRPPTINVGLTVAQLPNAADVLVERSQPDAARHTRSAIEQVEAAAKR